MLEVGPGYGATTDVLAGVAGHLTSVEIDADLAAMLRERFAGAPSVEIVDGDATALRTTTRSSPAQRVSRCCTTCPAASCRTGLFAEVARVLRPGAALVASDSLGSDELAAAHEDDTYNPVDPRRFRNGWPPPGSPTSR